MKVEVLTSFLDKEKNVIHQAGAVITVTEERFEQIKAANKNLVKEIAGEDDLEFPKHTGGGYYELSNGEKIKGKVEAFKAQAELDTAGKQPLQDGEEDPDIGAKQTGNDAQNTTNQDGHAPEQ